MTPQTNFHKRYVKDVAHPWRSLLAEAEGNRLLSHPCGPLFRLGNEPGFEPETYCFSSSCSNQLSYSFEYSE